MVGDEVRGSRECCAKAAKEAVEAYRSMRDGIEARERECRLRRNRQDRIIQLRTEVWIFMLFGVGASAALLYLGQDGRTQLGWYVWYILFFSVFCILIAVFQYRKIRSLNALLRNI